MDARAPVTSTTAARSLRRARGGADPPLRRVVRDALAGGDQRRQRPRAQPERRQRHPRGLRPARAGREVRRAGRRPRQRAGPRLPEDAARLQRPDLVPAGHAHAQHRRRRRAPARPDRSTRRSRRVFIYNHNPVIVHPDQNRLRRGLAREDLFVVGCDVAMTDSMAYADVVLPACTHFEHADLFAAYGPHWLQRADRVIPAVGESLPNTEIFRRLAARFGFDGRRLPRQRRRADGRRRSTPRTRAWRGPASRDPPRPRAAHDRSTARTSCCSATSSPGRPVRQGRARLGRISAGSTAQRLPAVTAPVELALPARRCSRRRPTA